MQNIHVTILYIKFRNKNVVLKSCPSPFLTLIRMQALSDSVHDNNQLVNM